MSNTLFDVLRNLSADQIRAVTDERGFKRGREFVSLGRLKKFTVEHKPKQRIVAMVQGVKLNEVIVSLNSGQLQFMCDCPIWDPAVACEHVVCALLAAREQLEAQATAVPEKRLLNGEIIQEQGQQFVSFEIETFIKDIELFKNTFESEDVFFRPKAILIPLGCLHQKLAKFSVVLDANFIALTINHKRPELATLEVSVVVAKQSSGIDWFELAPHIAINGVEISGEQRKELFSSHGGFIETDDTIKIIDEQWYGMLELLAKTVGKPTKKNTPGIPRLRILDLLELRKNGIKVQLPPEEELLLEGLSNFKAIEHLPIPTKLQATLRQYQKDGYSWLAFLYKNRFGACLADDMGLGKTMQIIAFLGGLAEGIIESRSKKKLPHLIVLPPTLVFNWQHELQLFYPSLRVKEYARSGQSTDFSDCDVVLTTYDRVRLDTDFFMDQKFHVVVCDEAQAIKNMQAARTIAVRQLQSLFTISVTGTPLENHLGEYYSIIDLAVPGLLPDYKDFMAAVKTEEVAELIRKTRPFVLRRTKEAMLQELPPKIESNILLNMAPAQQKIYSSTVLLARKTIDQAYKDKTSGQAQIVALTAIMRLRQICISPQMIDKAKDAPSPKIEYLTSALSDLVQEGSAALVFSQFTTCLDLIETALQAEGLPYNRIDGSTPMAKRKKIVEAFQGDTAGTSILLLSLKTGGVGLNLTRANYVFHVDPWWNPAVEHQASDRSHRIGQKQTVFVSRLVMHGTIEEKMMSLKEAKQQLFNDVMDDTATKAKGIISKEDLDLLFS